MPGTFEVKGTFPLRGKGLVAYGDIITGDVRIGEVLLIPLNSSTVTSAVIRSVEAIDGTPTGSHTALLLGEDELEIDMLHALGFDGETLTISPAEVDGFEAAKRRLEELLVHAGWPREIAWVDEAHITALRERVFVLIRGGQFEPEQVARARYRSATANCAAVRIGAVGIVRGMTLAAVWPIHELGQGEEMFIEDGVKVDVPASAPVVTLTNSRLRWWWIRRAYRK
jgi:hypothetical protein